MHSFIHLINKLLLGFQIPGAALNTKYSGTRYWNNENFRIIITVNNIMLSPFSARTSESTLHASCFVPPGTDPCGCYQWTPQLFGSSWIIFPLAPSLWDFHKLIHLSTESHKSCQAAFSNYSVFRLWQLSPFLISSDLPWSYCPVVPSLGFHYILPRPLQRVPF